MKHFVSLLLALTFLACSDHPDENAPEQPFITIEEPELAVDYPGVRKQIAVSSNCEWIFFNVPHWCILKKGSDNGREYLEVQVSLNDTDSSREATVYLSSGKFTQSLHIVQASQNEVPSFDWQTFPVNQFSNVKYELGDDDLTRKYQFTATELFINPSIRNRIFPGNLISRHTDDLLKITDYYDKYTFNAITLSSSTLKFKDLPSPSWVGLNAFVQDIIADLPPQNLHFRLSSPIQYTSHRHLHLLGMGNLGLRLDEMVSGKPYSEKEMEKRTGMIYTYSAASFRITMDYPEKLVKETIGDAKRANMAYINSMTYGKTALLLIETDSGFKTAKSVVSRIQEGENLSPEESRVKDELTVCYIYFDNKGDAQTIKGGAELIGRYSSEINTLDITPLSFTMNNFTDNAVGSINIGFDLP